MIFILANTMFNADWLRCEKKLRRQDVRYLITDKDIPINGYKFDPECDQLIIHDNWIMGKTSFVSAIKLLEANFPIPSVIDSLLTVQL